MSARQYSIGSRLGLARRQLGLDLTSFGLLVGISESTLKKYESDVSVPGGKAVQKITSSGINAHWLITGDGQMLTNNQQDDGFTYINTMSVGQPSEDNDQTVSVSRIAFRSDWIEKQGLNPTKLAVITAKSDAMSPTIIPGDSLLVSVFSHKEGTSLELGIANGEPFPGDGIYALRLENKLFVKRLQDDFAGGVYVKSDNPSYQQIHIDKERMSSLNIVGQIVWIGRQIQSALNDS